MTKKNMSNINNTQVQSTNDVSIVSKYSAVSKNYFKDDFIEYFVEKKKTRAPLINLGYYTRAVILNKLIIKFIEFLNFQKISKIISCGSGFDTTYWRLSDANLLHNAFFIEIDFPNVIKKKISLINQSKKLKSYLGKISIEEFQKINQLNFNYFLLAADLSNIFLIEKLFSQMQIDYSIPTLFLSECVITYMNETDSNKLIKWMADKFLNVGFLNYEQIHPEDGFGKVMLKHFDKLHAPLFSVFKNHNCESHYFRYKNLGFKNIFSVSEWDALVNLTTQEELQIAFSLELFDEFEEFHLKCVHYVIAIAGNEIISKWLNSFSLSVNHFFQKMLRKKICCDQLECAVELYKHSSCSSNENVFLFGGCGKQNRSSKVFKLNHTNFGKLENVMISKDFSVQLDLVYGSTTYFEINSVSYFCIYGGRNAPNKICNNGSAVIFELTEKKLLQRIITTEGNPIPRYRSPMVSLKLNGSGIHCLLFGGRTADLKTPLTDLWDLSLDHDSEKNLIYKWKKHERKDKNWPAARISHSSVACPNNLAIFIVGGFQPDSLIVFNDIWKWCCRSEIWQKLDIIGGVLPRYGHTSHLINNKLYLIGGVNTLEGRQPGLAIIDLNNLIATEYTIETPHINPVLFFNHTSEKSKNEDEILVFGGGGNCFSFGTYLNHGVLRIQLNQL